MFFDPSGEVTERDRKELSKSEIKELEELERKYKNAEKNNDFITMNKVHDEANKIRYTYNKDIYREDKYDYTHDGIFIEISKYSTIVDILGNNISGNVYFMSMNSANLYLDSQTVDKNDYICIDNTHDEDFEPNIQVVNSYRANRETICAVSAVVVQYANKHCPRWTRSYSSIVDEWEMHNLAYNITIKTRSKIKEQARSVDLNNSAEGCKIFLERRN